MSISQQFWSQKGFALLPIMIVLAVFIAISGGGVAIYQITSVEPQIVTNGSSEVTSAPTPSVEPQVTIEASPAVESSSNSQEIRSNKHRQKVRGSATTANQEPMPTPTITSASQKASVKTPSATTRTTNITPTPESPVGTHEQGDQVGDKQDDEPNPAVEVQLITDIHHAIVGQDENAENDVAGPPLNSNEVNDESGDNPNDQPVPISSDLIQ